MNLSECAPWPARIVAENLASTLVRTPNLPARSEPPKKNIKTLAWVFGDQADISNQILC